MFSNDTLGMIMDSNNGVAYLKGLGMTDDEIRNYFNYKFGDVQTYGTTGSTASVPASTATNMNNSLDNPGDSVSKGAVGGGGGMSSAGAQSAAGWSSLVNSFISNSMHKKYANLLEEQQLTIPRSLWDARSKLENLSNNQNMPGYDQITQGYWDSLAELTNKASETGEPSSVLKLLANSYDTVMKAIEATNIKNIDYKTQQQLALINFLSQVQSPYEQRIQEFDISKRLAAEQERMQGKKDLMEGATSLVTNESAAVGSVLNMFMGV